MVMAQAPYPSDLSIKRTGARPSHQSNQRVDKDQDQKSHDASPAQPLT
jgi:hypothetical protein